MEFSIPSYNLISELGRGGMGIVYLAEHNVLKRRYALKVMLDLYTKNPELKERLEREAQTLALLEHPNIVQIHDYIQFDGGSALVMEYVEGRNLEQMIGREVGPIPHDRALPLFFQILEAVAFAHKKGVIHRDLKPSNILVSRDNTVKVTDFGIAKAAGQSKMTKTGTMLGTPLYMAPEQILGKQVDHLADIYSLGMTLYVMLAGWTPFDEDETSEFAFVKACLEDPIPDPREFYPHIPEHIVDVVYDALERETETRITSCNEFKELLTSESTNSSHHNEIVEKKFVNKEKEKKEIDLVGWRELYRSEEIKSEKLVEELKSKALYYDAEKKRSEQVNKNKNRRYHEDDILESFGKGCAYSILAVITLFFLLIMITLVFSGS